MPDDIKVNREKIPNELIQFLRQKTYSLLIKGHTGTGKTTLALSILRHLNINKNCLYISTRVSPGQLFQYYPWIDSFFIQPKKTELTETSEVQTNYPVFVDARLDEPNSLFERITNELMDVQAPTIIIDTWDAVGFLMDKEALLNNVKVLQTWMERAGAKLIFVIESPEDKTLDFLVDGIVELREKHYNERRVREIFLSKLRGVRINKPSYIFSVNNSLFHSYDHYHPSEFADSVYFPGDAKLTDKDVPGSKSHFTTGYHELDELLGGGFPIGSTVSIELGPHINTKIAFALLSKIIVRFIASQNALVFQPFDKSGLEIITQFQKSFGSKKDLTSVIIVNNQSKKITADVNGTDMQLRKIKQEILKIKKKYQKKLLLSILGPDTVNLFSKMSLNIEDRDLFSFIKSNSDLSIFVSRRLPDNRHTHLSEISDIRLSILEIDGTMFLQSEIPWSQMYAIVVPSEKGEGIKLEPIV
jgi:KaiC/GvpD/RAD55 family RecA-like ATPase